MEKYLIGKDGKIIYKHHHFGVQDDKNVDVYSGRDHFLIHNKKTNKFSKKIWYATKFKRFKIEDSLVLTYRDDYEIFPGVISYTPITVGGIPCYQVEYGKGSDIIVSRLNTEIKFTNLVAGSEGYEGMFEPLLISEHGNVIFKQKRDCSGYKLYKVADDEKEISFDNEIDISDIFKKLLSADDKNRLFEMFQRLELKNKNENDDQVKSFKQLLLITALSEIFEEEIKVNAFYEEKIGTLCFYKHSNWDKEEVEDNGLKCFLKEMTSEMESAYDDFINDEL